jgi:hypothetical protein
MRLRWCVLAVPLLCGFTCGHEQDEGAYAFSQDQLISDPCGIVTSPANVATGTLTLIANDLRMDDFHYGATQMEMTGEYEWNVEAFYLDGSAGEVPVTVNGLACTADLVTVNLTATTDDPTHFHGNLSVEYEAHTQTACQCQATLTYRAAHE